VLVLAIDTASPAVTAGLVELPADGGAPVVVRVGVTVDARAHAERLTPHVREVLAGTVPDAIVCGVGPGPFTGLRVGMVTAAALGDGFGVPVHGVCSLDAIAVRADHDGPLLVATDARRREVYWAGYLDHGRTDGPHVQRPAEVPTGGFTAACGAGAHLYAGVLGLPLLGHEHDHPTPAGLVAVAADALRAGKDPEPFLPLYLRRPDAQPVDNP
jgi:tRNA threonylcarbamoyl adenosine modification protein YeaZ